MSSLGPITTLQQRKVDFGPPSRTIDLSGLLLSRQAKLTFADIFIPLSVKVNSAFESLQTTLIIKSFRIKENS